jgi:serine/threonine-protein kinase LATS1/2
MSRYFPSFSSVCIRSIFIQEEHAIRDELEPKAPINPSFIHHIPSLMLQVIRWRDTLRIPPEAQLSREAEDLILCLCCEHTQRLGRNGADDIKAHPFFHDIKFSTLRQQRSRYIPQIRYPTDTSNFDAIESSDKFHSKDLPGMTLENGKVLEHHAFYEFTFRRFFDDDNQPIAMRMNPPASNGSSDTNNPVYV